MKAPVQFCPPLERPLLERPLLELITLECDHCTEAGVSVTTGRLGTTCGRCNTGVLRLVQ